MALAAGVELKVVQDMLGHSSIVLTADTYTSVLPEVAHTAAENRRSRPQSRTVGPRNRPDTSTSSYVEEAAWT